MGVDRVSGHGDDGAVELGEVVHPVGEGSEALGVDKIHRVEHQADILLTLIVLEGDMADVTIDHGMGGEVGGRPGALEQRHGGGTYYCCL